MKRIFDLAYRIIKLIRSPKVFLLKRRMGQCGKDVVISMPCRMAVPQNVFMGDHTLIQPNCTFIMDKGRVFVGRWSVIASNCTIITDNHIPTVGINHRMLGRYHINDRVKDIHIEEDCWCGAGVTLLSGASMGRGSIAAAGAVVNKPVPPYAVVAGVPAKIIASVFSKEQVLKHEKYLYAENERMSEEEINNLFNTFFDGKKAIGLEVVADDDKAKVFEGRDMQYQLPQ